MHTALTILASDLNRGAMVGLLAYAGFRFDAYLFRQPQESVGTTAYRGGSSAYLADTLRRAALIASFVIGGALWA